MADPKDEKTKIEGGGTENKTEPLPVAESRTEPLPILPGAAPDPELEKMKAERDEALRQLEALKSQAAPKAAAPPPPAPVVAPAPGPVPVAPPAPKPAAFVPTPYRDDEDEQSDVRFGPHPSRNGLVVVLAAAILGAIFASVSTNDFMQHLDRQVHAIHCSFIPGAGREMGESGCKTVMMSPYSSFFRESVWGGVPVSLWALATFAYLVYRAGLLLWRGKPTRNETLFLVAATLLPVGMTLIFSFLSMSKVGATCKVCVGIYFSSALVFIGALVAHRSNNTAPDFAAAGAKYATWFGEGVAFVAVLTAVYLSFAPDSPAKNTVSGCGSLVSADDPGQVMLPLVTGGGESAIEVLDPLCPSCKAFDTRLNASSLRDRLDLKGVLFPLDNACNWMVTEAVHPGACAVSEALLCAGKDEASVHEMLRWAFAHQEELRTTAASSDAAIRSKIEAAFPKVKGCLGSPLVKQKLTKSLRWAVANAIPVLTPQLFVGNARMCDEDTDLGLEYTLSRLLSPKSQQARSSQTSRPAPAPAPKKEGTP